MIRRVVVTALTVPVLAAGGLLAWGELAPHEVSSTVEIAAPADKVYGILTDFGSFPEWNPFIVKAEGEPRKGARLRNVLRDSGGSSMTFEPKVLAAEPGRELRWIGRLWVPGIVDGEHYFRIEPAGQGRVRLTQGERFSGALVPVAGGQLKMEDEFAAMNAALKARAEAS
ncbi:MULTISPECIES: SRPBCC domain-containing protein [Actinomadura]|uniref:SRPBCC domain-containing protein n=1 Tax=Actinomadura litoris TaxID=2678616 RepID=A0A7K1L6M7_9ACTN|nr:MULTISPECIES: SRPBCC domain-containing protein [Actinomadura]MBT2209368.1 SRPBCC domain-containing protein [Actinomadura sp. NEAU-AAG7]MUN40060.1 SRPBCC domain-containing protein [Actinomadura litoris]